MIYIEQYQSLSSISEILFNKEEHIILSEEGLSVKSRKTGRKYFIEGEVSDYIVSLSHTYLWCALYNKDNSFTLVVIDKNGKVIDSLKLEEPFHLSAALLTLMPEENNIAISLLDGTGGSQGYCINLDHNQLRIYRELPENKDYMFTWGNRCLLADFDANELTLVSYPDFELITQKQYDHFEGDGMANVWQIDEHLGIYSTNQGIWYAFNLDTLEVIGECAIKGYEPITEEDEYYSHINTLIPMADKLLFEHWTYKNKEQKKQWLSVERTYLSSLIRTAHS